jgi:hypothetical protein
MKTLCGIAVVGLVLLVAAGPSPEAAGDPTATDGTSLLRECREAMRWFDAGGPDGAERLTMLGSSCLGYVRGLLTMHWAYLKQGLLLGPLFCLPAGGIRVIQGIRVIVHYLQTHPERLHLSEDVLALEAFRDAFPCAPAAARPQR